MTSHHPDMLSGALVFAGTRVPVDVRVDYLSAGKSPGRFLEGFPAVKREQAEAFLQKALDAVKQSYAARAA